jgi:hypothetical protein
LENDPLWRPDLNYAEEILAKAKTQSPVVEQVIKAYAKALEGKDTVPEDARKRLVDVLLGENAPTSKRIEEALFPTNNEEITP